MTELGIETKQGTAIPAILFVNKQVCEEVRELALGIFVYRVHHFKLHESYNWTSKYESLARVRRLEVLWTRPVDKAAAHNKIHAEVLAKLPKLKATTITLLDHQYMFGLSPVADDSIHLHLHSDFQDRYHQLPKNVKEFVTKTDAKGIEVCFRIHCLLIDPTDRWFPSAAGGWRKKNYFSAASAIAMAAKRSGIASADVVWHPKGHVAFDSSDRDDYRHYIRNIRPAF